MNLTPVNIILYFFPFADFPCYKPPLHPLLSGGEKERWTLLSGGEKEKVDPPFVKISSNPPNPPLIPPFSKGD